MRNIHISRGVMLLVMIGLLWQSSFLEQLHATIIPRAVNIVQWGDRRFESPLEEYIAIGEGRNGWAGVRADGSVDTRYLPADFDHSSIEQFTNVTDIAIGDAGWLLLLETGEVIAGGSYTNRIESQNLINFPWHPTNIVSIAGSAPHALALSKDGLVIGTGYQYAGECIPPAAALPAQLVQTAESASLIVRTDGRLFGWGNESAGWRYYGSAHTGVVDAKINEAVTFALLQNGEVMRFDFQGANTVEGIKNATAISLGMGSGFALQADGTVRSLLVISPTPEAPSWLKGVTGIYGGYPRTLFFLPNPIIRDPTGEPFHGIQTVKVGTNLPLKATFYRNSTVRYQWFRNGRPLVGETNSQFNILNASVSQAGVYTVSATDALGTLSSPETHVVLGIAAILDSPKSVEAQVGDLIRLEANVVSPEPAEFQWRVNGQAIEAWNAATGAFSPGDLPHTSLFNFPPATTRMSGRYDLVVRTAYGAVTTAVATVIVRSTAVLDQDQSEFAGWFHLRESGRRRVLAQTFIPSLSGKLSRIGFISTYMESTPQYPTHVTVVDVVDGNPGTNVLAEGMIPNLYAATMADFDDQGAYLEKNQQYAVVFETDAGDSQNASYSFETAGRNAYPRGALFSRPSESMSWTSETNDLLFSVWMWPGLPSLRIVGLPTDGRIEQGAKASLEVMVSLGIQPQSVSVRIGADVVELGNQKPFKFDWTPAEAGDYVMEAVASLDSGLLQFSPKRSLVVLGPRPPNDDFSKRIPLEQDLNNVAFSVEGATRENGEPLATAGATGRSVWWSWSSLRSSRATLEIEPKDADTRISVWKGTSLKGLELVATGTNRCEFLAQTNSVYAISVESSSEVTTVKVLHFVLNEMIVVSPAEGQILPEAESVTVSVSRENRLRTLSTVELSLDQSPVAQWKDSNTLTIAHLEPGLHELSVKTADDRGLITHSEPTHFKVRAKNDNFADATHLSGLSISTKVQNVGATKEVGEPHFGDNQGGKSLWYRWTAPESGSCVIQGSGDHFGLLFSVYSGNSFQSLAPLGGNAFSPLGTPVVLLVQAGSNYVVCVDSSFGEEGMMDWSLALRPRNDAFANRKPLQGTQTEQQASFQNASLEEAEYLYAPVGAEGSLWWFWRARKVGPVIVRVSSNDSELSVIVFKGDQLVLLQSVGSSGPPSAAGEVRFNALPNERFEIGVYVRHSRSGSLKIELVQETLRLLSPAQSSAFRFPASVSLDSRLDIANQNISSINYLANDTLIAHRSDGLTDAVWVPPHPGSYLIYAEATSGTGIKYQSLPCSILVYEGSSLPTPRLIAMPTSPSWFGIDAIGTSWVVGGQTDWFQFQAGIDGTTPALMGPPSDVERWVDLAAEPVRPTSTSYYYLEQIVWALSDKGIIYRNGRDPIPFPPGVTNWERMDSGFSTTYFTGDDGNVYIRGAQQVSLLPEGTLWKGATDSFALSRDGRFFRHATGAELRRPAQVTRWVDFRTGFTDAIVLGDDGNLYTTFLLNPSASSLQLTKISRPSGVNHWIEFDCGGNHVLALGDNGQIYGWGENAVGQLGIGEGDILVMQPRKISLPPGVSRWITMAAGPFHSVGLGDDCITYSWGWNVNEALGHPSAGVVFRPEPIPVLTEVCGEPVAFIEGPGALQPDGTLRISFPTILNRRYRIQYNDDLKTWKNADPTLLGTGGTVYWVDRGYPFTDSLPKSEVIRLYRATFTF